MAKLPTNTTPRVQATSVTDTHLYKAFVQSDHDYITIEVSGNDTASATLNATDEYFRMFHLLPSIVTLTLIK